MTKKIRFFSIWGPGEKITGSFSYMGHNIQKSGKLS